MSSESAELVPEKVRRVIGIDPSLRNTAVCVISTEPQGIYFETIKTLPENYDKKLRGQYERLQEIAGRLAGILAANPAELIAIEGYSFGSNKAFKSATIEAGALIRVACLNHCRDVIAIPPLQLKVFATRDGRADKAKMVAAIEGEFGLNGLTEHEADAAACAWAAAVIQGVLGQSSPKQAEIAGAICLSCL